MDKLSLYGVMEEGKNIQCFLHFPSLLVGGLVVT